MPSLAFQVWETERQTSLDEMEEAHARMGGTGPGRRVTTQQINRAYAVLLSSQFQGFCRDLHDECVRNLTDSVASPELREIFRGALEEHRQLDRGNPHPGAIGADFKRFDIPFWSEVENRDARTGIRQRYLRELNEWRNAIAHQDFDAIRLGGSTVLQLRVIRDWRRGLRALANSFDEVMRVHLQSILGTSPW